MESSARAFAAALCALTLLAGCASDSAVKAAAPGVSIVQEGSVIRMGVAPAQGVPLEYRLTIENPHEHEVRLVNVEVSTVGDSGGYSMNAVRHTFNEMIPARTARQVRFRAWVRVLTESESRSVDHPVFVRGKARFEGPDGIMVRHFSARLNEGGKTNSGRPEV